MRHALILLSCLFSVILSAAFPLDASEIDAPDLAGLPAADVVVLGEIHDNPAHHANQAAAVAAIAPKALVFEMLRPEQALQASPLARRSEPALRDALGWEKSGWPDFSMYYPIFAAAPDAAIYGGNLPREAVRRSVTEGAAAVFGPMAPKYGLDRPLPEAEQKAREAEQMEAHCDALPPEMLGGMVEAQRLRDAALARAVVQAMKDTGGPVAVITGSGHARKDRGVPATLAVAAPDLAVLSIGQMENAPEAAPPYDFWIVTPPAPREDPCARFFDKA